MKIKSDNTIGVQSSIKFFKCLSSGRFWYGLILFIAQHRQHSIIFCCTRAGKVLLRTHLIYVRIIVVAVQGEPVHDAMQDFFSRCGKENIYLTVRIALYVILLLLYLLYIVTLG